MDMGCYREMVETLLVGQQRMSIKASSNTTSRHAMLKLERPLLLRFIYQVTTYRNSGKFFNEKRGEYNGCRWYQSTEGYQ